MATPTAPEPSEWPSLSKIDPQFEQILKGMGPLPSITDAPSLDAVRVSTRTMMENLHAANPPDYTGVTKETISIPVRDGTSIGAIVYKPSSAPTKASAGPLIVLYHGGGWVIGFPEMEEPTALMGVREFGAVVVSVDYRMAPDHPFPTPVEDSWDALKWLAANASKLGADPLTGLLVGGSSAGGNISAIMALRARDEKLSPPVTGVWLYIPSIVHNATMPEKYESLQTSWQQNANAPMIGQKELEWLVDHYKPDMKSHLFSVLLWPSGFDGLPPHFFQLAGLDPLRDDGLIYERILRTEHGVKTRLNVYQGVPHGFIEYMPPGSGLQASVTATEDKASGLKWLLQK